MANPQGSIPLVDLGAQHRQIADAVRDGFERVFARTAFVLGAEVEDFERKFAAFTSIPHCIGVANGTDALELAVRALGIGAGDEVIVPANTFIATALGVSRAGATPVLADCDPVHQLLDVEQAARRITPRTKAIMPVHLFGQSAPMEAILDLATSHRLQVIEDAAQSQGATRNGRHTGSFGAVAGTSFYPGKNLGAYGDAGAVLTTSDEIAKKIRALRNYGSEVKYYHPETGFNSRLDTLQAVVLSAKLAHLARWNDERREAARRYDALLRDEPAIGLPATLAGNEHVWHLYVVRVARRDEVLAKLQSAGIGAGVHYPVPVHLQGAYMHLGYSEGDFPVTERAAKEILSLPMYPGITADQQERVATELRRAVVG